MLQSMESQRVRHDLVTEQQQRKAERSLHDRGNLQAQFTQPEFRERS